MAPGSRRRLAPRRRRNDEDESSLVGDIEDDSMSDGSAPSLGDEDAEISDASEEPDIAADGPGKTSTPKQGAADKRTKSSPKKPTSVETNSAAEAVTPAMDGASVADGSDKETELHFNETGTEDRHINATAGQAPDQAPKAPRRETMAQRARREHQEYLKQRDSNPAFVPNRGGFFLHDDRSPNFQNSFQKPFGRGRGRGNNGIAPAGRGAPINESMDKQWSHDLHERHESNKPHNATNNSVEGSSVSRANAAPAPAGPNREFSFSTVLGNVTVGVALPGMTERKAVPGLVKKQHTLLPTHRPPLRRDKPVRISIPNVEPSYKFPSTERSFIFIPRAMRPNQQPYMRGRGRGSFQASRRPSVMGSVYTPSVAMSRKSSFGGVARDNVRSPAGSNYGRPVGMEPPRPIVRMPAPPVMPMQYAPMPISNGPMYQAPYANGSVAHGVHSTAIPMHQPRPQKAVSLTNIESPTSLSVKAPQQQQQQPFHQQVPPHMAGAEDTQAGLLGQAPRPGGTPLSHIPEGAIYAQPFQPYPMAAGPVYYTAPYGNAGVFYPQMAEPMPGYGQAWVDPAYQTMTAAQNSGQPVQQPTAPANVPHLQNGMVYFADPSMGQVSQQMGQPGMMPVAGYGYPYPMPMYYQTQ